MDITVGTNIRAARLILGITQDQLSKHLKITFQQVQKYERGINKVSAGVLYETANFLKKPIGWFFDEKIELEILELHEQKSILRITKILMGLQSKRQFKAILALLESIVK